MAQTFEVYHFPPNMSIRPRYLVDPESKSGFLVVVLTSLRWADTPFSHVTYTEPVQPFLLPHADRCDR